MAGVPDPNGVNKVTRQFCELLLEVMVVARVVLDAANLSGTRMLGVQEDDVRQVWTVMGKHEGFLEPSTSADQLVHCVKFVR